MQDTKWMCPTTRVGAKEGTSYEEEPHQGDWLDYSTNRTGLLPHQGDWLDYSTNQTGLLPYHAKLGLGLLDQVVLFRLADAGEDARLWVEVQHVALETGEEVAETADAAQAYHTLGRRGREHVREGKSERE